jgi:tetratricopeptide (TPR) repeat protein
MGWGERTGRNESAPTLGPDAWNPELLLGLGEALLAAGDAKKAETVARRIVLLEPYSAPARILLAYALVAQERGSEATRAADDAVRLAPGAAASHEALAAAWITERRSADAEGAARTAISLDPGSANAHFLLSAALEMRKAKVEADHEYAIAIDLDPALDAAGERAWLTWRAPLLGALSGASFIAVHLLAGGLFERINNRFVAFLLLVITAAFVAAVIIGNRQQRARLARLGPYARTVVTLQTRRRRGQALQQVLAPLALLTTAIVGLSTLTLLFAVGERASVFLKVGDCFNTETLVSMDHVSTIPCTVPHDFEVYAVLQDDTPKDAPYPGLEALHYQAAFGCLALYRSYTGVVVGKTRAPTTIKTFVPEESYWQIGIRMRFCALADRDGHQLVGSFRKGSCGFGSPSRYPRDRRSVGPPDRG